MWVQLGVVVLTGTLCIYGDEFAILAWYVVPPRTKNQNDPNVSSAYGELMAELLEQFDTLPIKRNVASWRRSKTNTWRKYCGDVSVY